MMMKILKRKQKYTNIVLTYSNVNMMSEVYGVYTRGVYLLYYIVDHLFSQI